MAFFFPLACVLSVFNGVIERKLEREQIEKNDESHSYFLPHLRGPNFLDKLERKRLLRILSLRTKFYGIAAAALFESKGPFDWEMKI